MHDWLRALAGETAEDVGAVVAAFASVLAVAREVSAARAKPALGARTAAASLLALLGAAAVVLAAASLWTSSSDVPPGAATREGTLVRAALLGVIVAALWARRALRDVLAPPSRAHAALLALVAALGLGLRLAVEPAPLHSSHWIGPLVDAVRRGADAVGHGAGFGAWLGALHLAGLDPERALFLGNALTGALAPLAAFAACRALVSDPVHALFAALLYAVLPLHVRLSASETMHVIPSLLGLVALAGFAVHAKTGRVAAVVVATCAFSFAVFTRPDAAVLALAFPFVWVTPAHARRLADPRALAAPVVALGLGLPRLAGHVTSESAAPTSPAAALETFARALGSAGPPHVAFALLAAAGAVVALARRERRLVAVCLVALVATIETNGFDRNPANLWHLALEEWPFLVLLGAALPAAVVAWVGRVAGARAGALVPPASALVAAAIVAPALGSPILSRVWDEQVEWRFLKRSAPKLAALGGAKALTLVRLDQGDYEDRSLPTLPSHLIPPHAVVRGLRETLEAGVDLPAVFHRDLGCYSTLRSKVEPFDGANLAPMRPDCAAIEARYRLEPIAVERVEAPPFTTRLRVDAPEIGFFWLRAR